jgi:hypothetical protein
MAVKQSERVLVKAISSKLTGMGHRVATEVAVFHRSADIVTINESGEVWIIECKVASMKRAVQQVRTHKLAADKVFIGTGIRNIRESTRSRLRDEGIGVIYVHQDGSIEITGEQVACNEPWQPAREKLRRRIKGRT